MRKWAPLRRIGSRGWKHPDTEHYATVEHDYGAHGQREWGESLCGRKGRLMTSYPNSPKCKRCLMLAEKYGLKEAL